MHTRKSNINSSMHKSAIVSKQASMYFIAMTFCDYTLCNNNILNIYVLIFLKSPISELKSFRHLKTEYDPGLRGKGSKSKSKKMEIFCSYAAAETKDLNIFLKIRKSYAR